MLVNSFVLPLAATILIEGSAAYAIGFRERQFVLVMILVNLITNPFMNFIVVLLAYLQMSSYLYWIILPLELVLIPVEYSLLSYAIPQRKKELLRLSAVMNLTSFAVGLIFL